MQKADGDSSASRCVFETISDSDQLHVFGTWTFLSTTFGERHSFAFPEVVEARTVEGGVVEEQVFVCSGVDKPKAPVRQSLDRAFSHFV